MYYRRKLMLGLLEAFDGELNVTTLQKLLFLVTRQQRKPTFDFVPYKYGCFSFQANQDLSTMKKYELVTSTEQGRKTVWSLLDAGRGFFDVLKAPDQTAIHRIKAKTIDWDQRNLIRFTYDQFPYYATKSHIYKEILNEHQIARVESKVVDEAEQAFFTIGYEGISLETYLNKLILNDVRLLCDVRKNSFSMKFGFSKSQLKRACEGVGIHFLHLPDLGIESDKRKKLDTLSDYQELFTIYEATTLKQNEKSLLYLRELITEYHRVAITCFEKEVCMCHRGSVLKALVSRPDWNIPHVNL